MWLLSQGKCVGCGSPISQGHGRDVKGKTLVKCPKCTRVYVLTESGKYRRALLNEI